MICERRCAMPPRTTGPRHIEARPSAHAAVARRRAESGAYIGHVRHGRGVPRADVRVEHGVSRHRVERLQAEPHAVPMHRRSINIHRCRRI